MAEPTYRKLVGWGLGLTRRNWLYVSEDHLLQVFSTFVREHYRRFYFRDIEAIVVQHTRVGLAWNLVFAGVGLLGGLVAGGFFYWASQAGDEKVAVQVFGALSGGIAVLGLVSLLINVLLGPTCSCSLRFPGGLEKLSVPRRLRRARKLLLQLAPLIEAAQTDQQ